MIKKFLAASNRITAFQSFKLSHFLFPAKLQFKNQHSGETSTKTHVFAFGDFRVLVVKKSA
jgi:hypothetical protein